jgi:predicted AAA+ superfamily ATPase
MQIVRNPYVNRSMIRDPENFFGRRREVSRLASRIASDPPQSVAVIGERRVGKSSLLYYISRPEVVAQYLDEPEKTLFLFIDFQEQHRLDIGTFCGSVLERLQEALGARQTIDATPNACSRRWKSSAGWGTGRS